MFQIFFRVSPQDSIRDKLRPVSLAITHTIVGTRHHAHHGDHIHHHLGHLTPALSLTPPNTYHTEVSDRANTPTVLALIT